MELLLLSCVFNWYKRLGNSVFSCINIITSCGVEGDILGGYQIGNRSVMFCGQSEDLFAYCPRQFNVTFRNQSSGVSPWVQFTELSAYLSDTIYFVSLRIIAIIIVYLCIKMDLLKQVKMRQMADCPIFESFNDLNKVVLPTYEDVIKCYFLIRQPNA